MLNLKLLYKTSRNAVIEIEDGGIFHTKKPYTICINGKEHSVTDRVITSIYGLKPDEEYVVSIEDKELTFHTDHETYTLNVRDFGAKGDGVSNDTCHIQAAIMACPPDGRVYIPEGTYFITSLFLKSHLKIELGKGAVLKASVDRSDRPIIPGRIQSYDENSEYYLGTWEGNPLTMFSAPIHGMYVEDVVIYGQGILDGDADYNNWWKNVKVKNIAWRPRLIFLSHCKDVVIEGIQVQNSPSWTIHPFFSENLKFYNLNILNPKDSHNTDGLNPESCNNVEITGVYFSVGDDCIAIKSGKYYMGVTFKTPSQHITIRQCHMRDGHGSVTIGSEMAGGVKDITVKDCLFTDTDRGLRVKTRRGRGEDAVLDNITFSHIKMNGVLTPIAVNCFYFCDPDGHTTYVQSKEPMAVDERTPKVKGLYFKDLECRDCHFAATYIYGLPEQKIEQVEMENIEFHFAKEAQSGMPVMMDDLEAVSKMGVFINNVDILKMRNVSVHGAEGEDYILNNITCQK